MLNKIKRRQEAKSYRVEGDVNAEYKARKFIEKIRDMKLVEFPKLSFFNQIIRRSQSNEKGDYDFEKRTGRHSSLSRQSRERIISIDSCELPTIKISCREGKSRTDRQYERLKTLLDNYDGGRRISTE